jgi:hypothetical protein
VNYETLIAEHDQIAARTARLELLIQSGTPDVAAVVLALSDLSREVTHHLAHEDSFIYPRMIAGGNFECSAVAMAFIAEFADLTREWQAYLGEWNSECIAADWDHFRRETVTLLARIADRIRAENDVLYVVALKNNAIHLRERRSRPLAA